jgi:hypothetical protein
MATLYNRTAIVPVWLGLFGLLALFWSPITVVTGALLLTVGVVGAATMVILWRKPISVEVHTRP